jgi:DNA-binding MarR family transcriptional regulator
MDHDEHHDRRRAETAVRPLDVTPAMRRVLEALLEAPGELYVTEIAKSTGLVQSTVSRVVGRLLSAGWVSERQGKPDPARYPKPPRYVRLIEAARAQARELVDVQPATTLPLVRRARNVSYAALAARMRRKPKSIWAIGRRDDHQLVTLRRYFDALDASEVKLRVVFEDDEQLTEAATRTATALLHGRPASLKDVRHARKVGRCVLAERLHLTPDGVSKTERRRFPRFGTVRRYVEALGGRLELVVEFADGETYTLTDPASPTSVHARIG